MSKSKEDIQSDIIADLNGESEGWGTTYPYEEVVKAMNKYAKIESLEFCHWVISEQWKYLDYGINIKGWHKGIELDKNPRTDDELYNLYLQSKQK